MKLVMPTKKYKESYYELINSSKKNKDYEELGNAALKTNESFEEMIKRLKDRKIGKNIHKRDVAACVYWIIENDNVVGTIDMRYKLNQDYFERFGHVAYYIKCEERNKKYASNALNLIIKKYKKMHTKKILVTCLKNNIASKKVILNNNGILEKTVYDKIINDYISRYIIAIDKETCVVPKTAWLTTNRTCNNKCNWCYASNCKDRIMQLSDIKEYVKELKKLNINKIILIGGEPTIYENIYDVIRYISNKGISVSMASNGRMFSDNNFSKKIVKAGLKNCNISIKGSNEKEYIENTNSSGFNEMVEGYHNLKKLGINVSTSYVLCDNDYTKFDEFLEEFIHNKLDNIVFQLYKPSVEQNNNNYKEPTILEIARLIEYVFIKMCKTNIKFSFEMSIPLCCLDENILNQMIEKECISTCCHISKGSGIIFDSNFNILPCNHFVNHPLNKQKIDSKNIYDFWNSDIPKMFREKIRTYPNEICQKCNKWKVCGGGCFLRWLSNDSHNYINSKYCEGGD